MAKYQKLVEECQDQGWRVWCFSVEVECRRFTGQSIWKAFRSLGVTGNTKEKAAAEASKKAEEASSWIWRTREENWASLLAPGWA
jgi:hypothetical protein